jgi:hypothetical protein
MSETLLRNEAIFLVTYQELFGRQWHWCYGNTGRMYLSELYDLLRYRPNNHGVAQSVQCLTTDRTIGDRSPAEEKDLSSSICVQTSSGPHPASYPVGTGVFSPRVKRGRSVTLTTHPDLVKISMSKSYTSLPTGACMAAAGHLYRPNSIWIRAAHGKMRNGWKFFAEKPWGKIPFARLKCRWKIILKLILWKYGIMWTGLIWS